jgi:hypothetical protein
MRLMINLNSEKDMDAIRTKVELSINRKYMEV